MVEDNEIDSSQIAKILSADNIEVIIAEDGKKAMDFRKELKNGELLHKKTFEVLSTPKDYHQSLVVPTGIEPVSKV